MDGDTLILSGAHELLFSNGTTYTVTGTSDKVKAEDFKTVILNATPTDDGQRATYAYSTRWDAPDTHLIINVKSDFENCDGVHLTNWNPHINVGKLTAHIDGASTSDAVNLSHDGTSGYAIFGEVDLTVEHGHGMRANAKLGENQSNTITVNGTAKITINGARGSTAVFAGDDQRYGSIFGIEFGAESKGRGDVHLLGETFLFLNGSGNYGIQAGKNGNIDVNDLHIESIGADSFGVAATNRNVTYGDSLDASQNRFGSVVTMTGKTNVIHMNGANGVALLADSQYGKIVSGEVGVGTMDVVGDVKASKQGTIDLTATGTTSIVGTVMSSGAGSVTYRALGGLKLVAPQNDEESQYATAIFAGDKSAPSSGRSSVVLTYGANGSIQGDVVAVGGGLADVSPASQGALTVHGDVLAANGGEVRLKFGSGSYWEGRTDDYVDADSPEWANGHNEIFQIQAPEFSADVTSSGSVHADLGTGSTWKLTGQSWVTSLTGDNNIIDLGGTEDGANFALHIGEIHGSNNVFLMNLSEDGSGNMLYVYQGTTSAQSLRIKNPEAVLSLGVGERIRFATVASAGMGFEDGEIAVNDAETALFGNSTRIAGVGFFDEDFAIEYVARGEDEQNAAYDGGAQMSDSKPGSDYVNAIYDDPEAQNVYLVRTGNRQVSDAGQTILGTARATYWNAVALDRWDQRYGDRRYDENRQGIWARVKHERLGTDAGEGDFRSYNTIYQFGYDYTKTTQNCKMIWGVAVDRMEGNTNYKSITGDGGTDRTGVSLYATYLGDTGGYGDLVLKAGRLSADYEMFTPTGTKLEADYSHWMYGVSFEAGHRFDKASGWFLEPQLQAQYLRITAGDYSTAQTRVEQDAIDSVITRAGFRLGKFFSEKKDSLGYFKADVLREWMGEQEIRVRDRTTSAEGADVSLSNHGMWFDVGAGFQTSVTDGLYAYGDVEYRFGNDLEKTWIFNLGARYAF